MKRTPNHKARELVTERREFIGNNTFGRILSDSRGTRYAVYSYGQHFPLFAHINGKWVENSDRYSVTTSKHKTQLRPPQCVIHKMTTREITDAIYYNKA